MKDWKDYHLFRTIGLNECKTYGKAPTDTFYDKRIMSAFQDLFATPRPLTKLFFTKTTMAKFENNIEFFKTLDSTLLHNLSFLYQGRKEVGACLCDKEHLGFVYIINPKTVKMIIVKGASPKQYSLKESVVGCVIIDIEKSKPEAIINSFEAHSKYLINNKHIEPSKEFKRLLVESDKVIKSYNVATEQFLANGEINPIWREMKIHGQNSNLTALAVNMFLFLKLHQSGPRVKENADIKPPRKESEAQLKKRGIIIVDVNWDSELFILNPFSVCEHVKYQWYKDENREWQKKVIYIAPFKKKGYHRRSTKELQQLKQNPK